MANIQTTDVHFAPQAPKYRVFEGPRRVDVETAISKDNRQKASVKGLMQFRLGALKSGYAPAIELAWGRWYDASTQIAYNKGQVKIGEGFCMPENPELKNGALILTEEQYDSLQGKTFSRKELEKAGINEWLTKSKVLKHPVWQAVAGNKRLLQQYADIEFKKYDLTEAMGIYLTQEIDVPTQRAFALYVGGFYDRSGLGGGRYLDYDARLVGYAENLEQKVSK